MMTKIVLVGAGSIQFGAQLLGDIFQSKVLTDSEIVFNDINPVAVEKTRKLAQEY
ncbi:MAG: alpha-glucosidase, partial [Rhodobacteraceae bacterium]|nr:alpha-glucosidase [Paracoccaceae bacterium]